MKYLPPIAIALLCAASSLLAEDVQYWATINTSNISLTDSLKTKTHAELRFPEAEYWSYFRLSQKFSWKVNRWTIGTHPTIEGSRSRGVIDWKNTYRIDLELNPPKFKIGENGPTVSMRNRWEVRWKEGRGSEVFDRIRQYTKLTWKTEHAFFKSYSLANEIFYEVDKALITLNRFYPLSFGVGIYEDVSTSFYLMYQSKRIGTSDDWSDAYIGGISVSF